ncbi:glycoside hydrolase family 3 N-terminal domain-containing protein [Lunatimonas salinarum]|uniref:glycoside hydrolase family 3 N-terminal domain-containing protein n=1 Tax=Lunatimonas salinarum TaxID=1774590 RepID=UPI001FD806AC|nr:glycoside hydrolase family 3 N-terminal domain-containing protein [Lunatimonas salinarum]
MSMFFPYFPFLKRLPKGCLTVVWLSWILAIEPIPVLSQTHPVPYLNLDPGLEGWVEETLQSMDLEERISQLIMIPVYSNKGPVHVDSVSNLVKRYKVGGMIFFQGGPVRQAHMINRFQRESKVPLMISIDGEWGLAMRLDSTLRFPYQMALGAIRDDSLIYEMGRQVAKHTRRAGLHVNFAPVVDINNNPANPVIGFRSFGEDKERVARKALAYMRGMQDEQVLASAKHFPGHGDTNVDSHYGLPVIHFSKQRLQELELYPFSQLMQAGLGSVMVAHMHIPVLDSTPNLASTLSPTVVTDLLKKEMNYEGLVFTDALNMQGVAKYYEPGVVDVKALLAGNDMLLNTMNVPATIREVKKALEAGQIAPEEIDARVRKVLRAKAWLGLSSWQPVEVTSLIDDLKTPSARHLSRELAASSLTLLKNDENILPLAGLGTYRTASLSMGVSHETAFQRGLARYQAMDHFYLPFEAGLADINRLIRDLSLYDRIIVGVHGISLRAGNDRFGITPEMNLILKQLNQDKEVVVSVFGNVYALNELVDLPNASAVVAAYQETEDTQDLVSQMIFGGIGANGTLPVRVSAVFPLGAGLELSGGSRVAYGLPESIGVPSDQLAGIDSLVHLAIREGATPGAQVLVAKEGKVFFHRAYGHHGFDSLQKVSLDDLYDLASITKISTALAAFMHLKGEGKFDENRQLGEYLPMAKGSNKETLVYKDILTHQSGLTAWISFWQETQRKNGKFKWYTFKQDSSGRFPMKVANHLYIHRKYTDKIYRKIMDSGIKPDQGYVYSDLSFILAPKVVEHISKTDFVSYIRQNIYNPLGAQGLTFNPYERFPLSQVVPTEYDSLFRRQQLHGTVHDEGAAMLGGISGHAGLFGSANELSKLMHLYLYDGVYGGETLIQNGVVHRFSACVYCEQGINYRALGFDRPNRPGDPNGNAAPSAPATSFGHSGFTGTYTWIDLENDLVYIFLSNRVNPTRENRKLYQLNIRTGILEVVYEALKANGLYESGHKKP